MSTMQEVFQKLRKRGKKNYWLLFCCIFFSEMLITAFITIMCSPTVLNVLPEGGDSRKQILAIFSLAVIGCGIFTAYAAGLFLKSKAREVGIFKAIGASKRQISENLFVELSMIAIGACVSGTIAGIPLTWLIWNFFRMAIVNTPEMQLQFEPLTITYSILFFFFVICTFGVMGIHFTSKTNIMEVVNEQHKSEPIREVKSWYGVAGILLIIAGGILGHKVPGFCIEVLHWYPNSLIMIFYLPVLIGVYMILLHTIVNGWGRGKGKYHDIIPRSTMKFQGRQTVRNMFVMVVLIAGGYFAVFYTPMMVASSNQTIASRTYDFIFPYRMDLNMISEQEIEQMAQEKEIQITDYMEIEMAALACDGEMQVEESGGKYHYEYRELLEEQDYVSEEAYRQITGKAVEIAPGSYQMVADAEGGGTYWMEDSTTRLTNPVTGQILPVAYEGKACDDTLYGKYILDDGDYQMITQGLTPEWKTKLVVFNSAETEQTYAFSEELMQENLNHSTQEVAVSSYYDRIVKRNAKEAGEAYWGDNTDYALSLSDADTSDFQIYWKYQPMFRLIDQNTTVSRYAVFLMLFVYVSIICFATVGVISYTRCLTIAAGDQAMFEDIRRLGANPKYLRGILKNQIGKVFLIPMLVGSLLTDCLYLIILCFNDSTGVYLSRTEIVSLGVCLGVQVGISILGWLLYRQILAQMCNLLKIQRK